MENGVDCLLILITCVKTIGRDFVLCHLIKMRHIVLCHPSCCPGDKAYSNAPYIFTQSLSSGTNPLSRGTDLYLGLGQCSLIIFLQTRHWAIRIFHLLYLTITGRQCLFNKHILCLHYRHTTTLLSNQLLIFGGRKTATYLNDLHILDLGKALTVVMWSTLYKKLVATIFKCHFLNFWQKASWSTQL